MSALPVAVAEPVIPTVDAVVVGAAAPVPQAMGRSEEELEWLRAGAAESVGTWAPRHLAL